MLQRDRNAGTTAAGNKVRVGALLPGFLLAIALACGGSDKAPTQPSPSPNSPIYYTAIGASDAIGVGASAPCPSFTSCPDGTGYVSLIARGLGGSATVTLMNLGIPAAVIGPDIQAIGNQYGRGIPGNFIEQEAPFVPKNSTVVTIFAGGNDTNTIAAAVDAGAGGSNPNAYMDQQIRAFADDYATLIRGVRDRAGSPRIVVANLPNFAGLPFTASFSVAEKRIMQRISVGFTDQVNALASQGIPVVDLLCDPRMYQQSVYSPDGFHPNDTGYRYLAEAMLKAINNPSGYPAPSAGCPQRTFVTP